MRAEAGVPPGAPPERFLLLDGLRAVAAVIVVTAHVASLRNEPYGAFGGATTPLGKLGVCIFFLISGFLLYRPFVLRRVKGRPMPSRRVFWTRRALRILPAYWFALTALAVYPGISDVFSERWWIYYGLAQTYDHYTAFHGLGPAWSLNVEVMFYLLLPLYAVLAGAAHRRGRNLWEGVALAFLAAAALLVHSILGSDLQLRWMSNLLWGTFTWFAVGMAIAIASVHLDHPVSRALFHHARRRAPIAAAGAVAAFLYLSFGLGIPAAREDLVSVTFTQALAEQILLTLAAVLVFLPAVANAPAAAKLLGTRWMRWSGLVSYGVFLWHFPIAAWFSQNDYVLATPFPLVTLWICTIIAAHCAAAFSYYVVERPFLGLKRRELQSPPAARVVEPVPEAQPRLNAS